jgi:hypothetical protein
MRNFTKTDVENWMGSDNLDPDSFLDLLTDILNKEYTVDAFVADVTDFINQGESK